MGVRCTLLGHKYGDSEIEREREERGDEAVVTIREVRTCARCGDRSVVSENKEVTSVEPATDGPEAGAPDASGEDLPDPLGSDDLEPELSDSDAGPAAAEADVDEATAPERDPETDDGVILEDDGEDEEPDQGRAHGEWPDADEDHGSAEADPVAAAGDQEPAEWPDAEGEDEGIDAGLPDDETPDVEYPRVSEEDAALDSPSRTGDADSPDDSELERTGEATAPAAPSTAGTELYCPACGYRDPSRDGSLREGDICPECKQGYLAAQD